MKKNGDGSNTSEKNVKRPHFGIFSDVHSNLEALSVVLEHLEHQGVNSYLSAEILSVMGQIRMNVWKKSEASRIVLLLWVTMMRHPVV